MARWLLSAQISTVMIGSVRGFVGASVRVSLFPPSSRIWISSTGGVLSGIMSMGTGAGVESAEFVAEACGTGFNGLPGCSSHARVGASPGLNRRVFQCGQRLVAIWPESGQMRNRRGPSDPIAVDSPPG